MSKAECLLCNGKYEAAGMGRHLRSCFPKSMKKTEKGEVRTFFHVRVTCRYAPDYWLHLKIRGDCTLKLLDRYLRDLWLECCGHMSSFRRGREEVAMSRKLRDISRQGTELLYEYDFGTTTELQVKILGEVEGRADERVIIEILSRNEAPEAPCDECGKVPAVQICTECEWEDGGWLCSACAEAHECDEEMRLPVVNSPRTGVCGYTG